jgi:hypothetical protein
VAEVARAILELQFAQDDDETLELLHRVEQVSEDEVAFNKRSSEQ